jgi:hypothetical protein
MPHFLGGGGGLGGGVFLFGSFGGGGIGCLLDIF